MAAFATTSIYSSFRSIRNAAGLPQFRIYDCRVQAITKLLSDPNVSPQVSKEIAGHISQRMQSRYSIQLFSTKKAALDGLDDPAPVLPSPKAALLLFPEGAPHAHSLRFASQLHVRKVRHGTLGRAR